MKPPMPAGNLLLVADVFDKWDQDRGDTSNDQVQRDIRSMASFASVLDEMPPIVCLVGSTRYAGVFAEKNLEFTLAGKVVLSIGAITSDAYLGIDQDYDLKHRLDVLHLWKILLADEVYCINVDGYIGPSTARELGFAKQVGKPITYLVPPELGQVVRMDFEVPAEMVDWVIEARKAMRVPTTSDVPGLSKPTVDCFINGCPETVALVEGKVDRGNSPLWVSDTRGGVTRWFCSAQHLTKYIRARRKGRQNGYEGGRPGKNPARDYDRVPLNPPDFEVSRERMSRAQQARRERERNAKESALRGPEVKA